MDQISQPGLRPHFIGTDGRNVVLFVPAKGDFRALRTLEEQIEQYLVEQELTVSNVTMESTYSGKHKMLRLALTAATGMIGGEELLQQQVNALPPECRGHYSGRCLVQINEVFGSTDQRYRYTDAYFEIIDPALAPHDLQEIEYKEGVQLTPLETHPLNGASRISCQIIGRSRDENYGSPGYQPGEVIGRVAAQLDLYIDGRIRWNKQRIDSVTNLSS